MKPVDKEKVVELMDGIAEKLQKFQQTKDENLIVEAENDLALVALELYDFLMSPLT